MKTPSPFDRVCNYTLCSGDVFCGTVWRNREVLDWMGVDWRPFLVWPRHGKGVVIEKAAPYNVLHQKQTFEPLRRGYSLNTEAVAYFADGASFVVTIAQRLTEAPRDGACWHNRIVTSGKPLQISRETSQLKTVDITMRYAVISTIFIIIKYSLCKNVNTTPRHQHRRN